MKKRIWLILLLVLALSAAAFAGYTGQYYRAGARALSALQSDETVSVVPIGDGWLFDGPSESDALIFYPGGKVEETAYAPLLHRLAEGGLDVYLIRMPFRLAVLSPNSADRVIESGAYERRYIGGHSLGGAMAASYAAAHADKLDGVVLLAAYPTKVLDESLSVISIYGTEDGVLNRTKLAEGEQYLPQTHESYEIEGGNHAQFGDYGEQRGDGEAAISAEEQQRLTAALILQALSQTN